MGLSSSKTKTTSDSSQNTNQTESGTTTPITPDWLQNIAQNYVGKIGAFGDMDPNQFVAGAAPLHQMAWDNAGSLGDWRSQAATAAGMAQQAGQGGANLAGAMGRWAGMAGLTPNVQMSGGGGAQMAANALGGDHMAPASPMQMQASEQHTTNLPPPTNAFSGASGIVSGAGYSPPPSMPGYAQARTGQPIGGGPAYGYNPSTVDPAQIAQTPGATASNAGAASLLDNFNAYQNPYDTQVRQTALSDFDNNAAQRRAALEAQGARNGAFGGSRFGIAQGQLDGDLARGRATLDAGLLDQGFNTAAGLSQYDAGNRQQANLFNAQNETGVSQFNAGEDYSRAAANAGFGMQGRLANQGAYDTAGQFNAGANNQVSEFNAGQQDNDLARRLQAAGMLGGLANDYGSGTRADLGTMAQLGDQQRAIEEAYAMAGPAQLQLMGQLSGMTPYDILVGRQVNGNTQGTMTGTGTQTTTQTPSLFSQLLAGAAMIPKSVFGGQ